MRPTCCRFRRRVRARSSETWRSRARGRADVLADQARAADPAGNLVLHLVPGELLGGAGRVDADDGGGVFRATAVVLPAHGSALAGATGSGAASARAAGAAVRGGSRVF